MAFSVSEIQARISAIVDQDPTSVTEGDETWATRLKFINMAQTEWQELYDWQALYKEYNTQTSTVSGNTSVSLPSDFRKLSSFPKIALGNDAREFPEVRAQERSQKNSSDKFVYFLGNPANGYTMVVNSGLADGQLPSGASIFVPYYATAQSLVSGSDVSMIPDPSYLVQRAVALHWEASDDARFPQAKTEADKLLQRLLERENVFSEAANDESRVRTVEEKRHSFRIGRN